VRIYIIKIHGQEANIISVWASLGN